MSSNAVAENHATAPMADNAVAENQAAASKSKSTATEPVPSLLAVIGGVAYHLSCKIHRLFFKVFFGGIFLVCHVLMRLEYSMGLVLYFIRGHDTALIHHSPALVAIGAPKMQLRAPYVGESGCRLGDIWVARNPYISPRIPTLYWTLPPNIKMDDIPIEFALVCEDPDWPVPRRARLHCLIYNIGHNINQLRHKDLRRSPFSALRTIVGAGYVNVKPYDLYAPPDPLFGHGVHRYIFTIIALKETLQFPEPRKVTRDAFIKAIDGKVVAYGQWECHYSRAWSAS